MTENQGQWPLIIRKNGSDNYRTESAHLDMN